MRQLMIGTWRSFKRFCFSGKIEEHSLSSYTQICIDEAGDITIMHSDNKRNAQIIASNNWRIEDVKKR